MAILLIFTSAFASGQTAGETKKWVGTWSCAPYAAAEHTPPPPYLANNTLRQIVRVSIGGDTLRLKFSNITCSTPVTMNSVNIAVLANQTGSAIDAATLKPLTFNGNDAVTMNPYSEVYSDPLGFPLTPGTRLAITIYYGACETAPDMTFHYGSRTDSYILRGDQSTSAAFSGSTTVERWYNLSTIEVLAPSDFAAIGVLGNSITDGYGLHGGLKNKWTDKFSEKLLNDTATDHVSVLNLGIGATWLTTSGISRFRQDILNQSGLRWVIVFYGVNDIGGNLPAANIIDAYEKMIEQAHLHNIRIYGATITPFKGHGYYSEGREAVRNQVNEWIRTPGNFDVCIDFDKVIRDPSDTTKMQAAYSNDWLHPNAEGYRVLGESVDAELFTGGDTIIGGQYNPERIEEHYFEAECSTVGENWDIKSDIGASNGAFISVKDGVQSLNFASEGDDNVVDFTFSINIDSTYYLYARLNCPSPDDDSYWVKLDNGNWVMCNGLGTSGWQWVQLQTYNLTAGEHNLSVTYREDGASFDKICISNYIFAPLGMGEEAVNICEPDTTSDDPDDSRSFKTPGTGFNLNNYPNPFQNNTVIEFELQDKSFISLNLFSLVGEKIAEIAAKEFTANRHQIEFACYGIPPGVYMLTLTDKNRNLAHHKILKR
ncbi:MAG: T9SS type A sorting domain-containing protein [Prolixibacteraceae bacterium]|nr:T9SS type A sorting domain-containing protein [Prolixibacteraceae bacterium]